jgi:kinesin family protein 11
MRPPPKPRGSVPRELPQSPAESNRPASAALMRNQRSPSVLSNAGTKRKERDYETDAGAETNIHVVVRCRGRSDREVKENSGVVVSTEGAKGKTLELSMGPNAVSNKTYHFDKVFSPAADQGVIFEDVVTPILNEVRVLYMEIYIIRIAVLTTAPDAFGFQLHHIRIRSNWYRENIHHVRRHD